MQSKAVINAPSKSKKFLTEIWKNREIYLLIIPAIAWYIVMCYFPMGGLSLAFKSYKGKLGIWGSPWVGLKIRQRLRREKHIHSFNKGFGWQRKLHSEMKTWRKGKPGCFCARFDEEWKAMEIWQDRGWAKCGKLWETQQGLCLEIPSIFRDKDAPFLWV